MLSSLGEPPFFGTHRTEKCRIENERHPHAASEYRNQSAVHRLNNIGSEPHEIRRR